MPLLNPFRRTQPDRPSLRQNAASVAARLARVVRRPAVEAPKTPAPAPADGGCDDTELLTLGRQFEAARLTEMAACEACNDAAKQNADREAPPELEASAVDAGDIAAALAHRLADIPARTADGLRLKIRALSHYNPSFFRLSLPDNPDPDQVLARSLLLDARNEAPAPQPAETLVADILSHWPIWAAEQRDYDTPEAERVEERRLALIEAADALPATPGAIVPKALASAWLAYVDNWRAGWARDDHTTDGRLALDIHAALTSESPPEKPAEPGTPKFRDSFADRVDFASATLKDLVAIHDTAKLVGEVAQAVAWQGRCRAPSARNPYASTYNAAGELMAWLSDKLIHVEHLAYAEMKKRQPADRWDRERRLAWIAAPIIENGDTNETAAFIGELAAFMADEARG